MATDPICHPTWYPQVQKLCLFAKPVCNIVARRVVCHKVHDRTKLGRRMGQPPPTAFTSAALFTTSATTITTALLSSLLSAPSHLTSPNPSWPPKAVCTYSVSDGGERDGSQGVLESPRNILKQQHGADHRKPRESEVWRLSPFRGNGAPHSLQFFKLGSHTSFKQRRRATNGGLVVGKVDRVGAAAMDGIHVAASQHLFALDAVR
jgi:hypothetical protein